MANVILAHLIEETVVFWTDGSLQDQGYSRRNIIALGNNCVALHDNVEAWLPRFNTIISEESLHTLSVEDLANALLPRLQEASPDINQPFGVIVVGFLPNGIPAIKGLWSGRNFEIKNFAPHVIGGLPTCIMNYIFTSLSSIPNSVDNLTDKILLAGTVYNDIIISKAGLPNSSLMAILHRGQGLAWLSNEDITERANRNGNRLRGLAQTMINHFLGNN